MDANTRSKIPGQVVVGLVAIALGVTFLLGNLGMIDVAWLAQAWPLIFVLFGFVKILQGPSDSSSRFVIGGIFIFGGLAMTLHKFGLFNFSWHTWWPVSLIALGLLIMTKRHSRRRRVACAGETVVPSAEQLDATLDVNAILGGYRRLVRSQDFRGGQITAIMGGCEIDLRNASFTGEAVLDVFAFWGGIELKVPTDWTVVLQGNGILGGFDEKTAMPPDSSKRLIVRGLAIMGGMEIKN